MKIGILTFHRSRNYGAVLQAYGLMQYLINLGNDVEIIDYRCPQIENELSSVWNDRNYLKAIAKRAFAHIKDRKFQSFNNKYLKITANKQFDINNYGMVISGSDQIWNNLITGNDKKYFLQGYSGIKVAYAASCGDKINLQSSDYMLLEQYKNISVREEFLQKALFDARIEAELVPDPTILAGKHVFDVISSKRIVRNKYVFVFMIWKSEKLINIASEYALRNGMKVITNKTSKEFFLHCSPMDFVSWIKYSEVVFTNSFHGTVFSLLFNKAFMSSIIKNDGERNSRIKQLLEQINCHKNIINDENSTVDIIPDVDWDMVNKELGNMKNCGEKYFERVFQQ